MTDIITDIPKVQPPLSLTDEQVAIMIALSRSENTVVNALAGTGKSTTIAYCVQPGSLILTFNTRTKKDMEKKLKALGKEKIPCWTLNGLGHRAFGAGIRKRPVVMEDKLYKLVKDEGVAWSDFHDIMSLVKAARTRGIVPAGKYTRPGARPDTADEWQDLCTETLIDPALIPTARAILTKCYAASIDGTVDYDDQIYMSAYSYASFPTFTSIIVDESQDIAPANLAQLQRFARSIPFVAVGDENQSIYAWRGADSNAMQKLRGLRPSWTTLPLTLSYRVPRMIADRYSYLGLRSAPGNATGSFRACTAWDGTHITGADSAILCRNNAPLIRIAFRLMTVGVPVNLVSRDIFLALKRILKKTGYDKAAIKAFAEKNASHADDCDALLAVLEYHRDLKVVEDFLSSNKKDALTLSTIHRAKGLEWSNVYHLNPWLIPSRYALEEPDQAKRAVALQQERNLRYVAETRTKDALYTVNEAELQS